MNIRRWLTPLIAVIGAILVGNFIVGLPLAFSVLFSMFLLFFTMIGLVASEKRESAQDLRELAKESVGSVRQTFAVSAFVILRGTKRDRSLKLLLTRAGMGLKPIQVILIGFFGGFLLSAILFFLTDGSPVSVSGLVLIPFGLYAFISVKARRRVRAFDQALPILLRTISASMLSGRSFEQSLISSAENSEEEAIHNEIGYAMQLISVGQEASLVYRNLAERMDSAGFLLLSQAYQITQTTGAKLEKILNSVANSIEARHQLEARIKALSAEGKLSAVMITAMPPILYLAMRSLNPRYIATLTADIRGWALIGAGIITNILGIIWIKGLITFKD